MQNYQKIVGVFLFFYLFGVTVHCSVKLLRASFFPLQMTGRPIQVETGYGERFPSADTRTARNRESDSVVIEVSCDPALAYI